MPNGKIADEDVPVLLDAFEESRPDFEQLVEVAAWGDVDPKRIWVCYPAIFELAITALAQKRKKIASGLIAYVREHYKHAHVPKKLQDFYYTGIKNIDEIAELLKLPTYEDVSEQNADYIWRTVQQRTEDHLGPVSEDLEMEWQAEAENEELFKPWHRAVMSAAKSLFGEHRMMLVPRGKVPKNGCAFEYVVRPDPTLDGTWTVCAQAIMETINGIGMFTYGSVQDFLDSGPYTPKGAVLSHLGWVREYPRVYGVPSAQMVYERSWL